MSGIDLMVIKELMRHKSYQMTLRYAHLHPDHLKGTTEVLCGARVSTDTRNEKIATEKKSLDTRFTHAGDIAKVIHLPTGGK